MQNHCQIETSSRLTTFSEVDWHSQEMPEDDHYDSLGQKQRLIAWEQSLY